ncbi:MAG: hypothetical protein M3P50_06125 [Actinomycetota bacterium]|nr:hypothetical protein [Actinomycetota bacterium]
MATKRDKVTVELVGEVAELEDNRRYEVQRERGCRLIIVTDQPPDAEGEQNAKGALYALDHFSGALNTDGELRRTVDAMRDERSDRRRRRHRSARRRRSAPRRRRRAPARARSDAHAAHRLGRLLRRGARRGASGPPRSTARA